MKTQRMKKAGTLQTGCLIVFCCASLLGTVAFTAGLYWITGMNAALMAVTFYLYQVNSRIIEQELQR